MPPHRCRTDRLDPAADRDGLDRRGFAWGALLLVIEMARPVIAERSKGGTPWHAHHIADRYGLLTIITLGEGVIGTVASLSAVVESQGWTSDAALVAVAGTGLTFGLWWMYFTARRRRCCTCTANGYSRGATATC
jgi:low temperature requirement protein LtrA